MEITKWMNEFLPGVVDGLYRSIREGYHVRVGDYMGLSGRQEVYEVLDDLLAVLFPGSWSRDRVQEQEIAMFIDETLRRVSLTLIRLMRGAFKNAERSDAGGDSDTMAEEALFHLMRSMPRVRNTLIEDVEAAYNGDPAATSFDEIVLSYPCIDAIATYRIAHLLYEKRVPIIPRIMGERAHSRTGIDIHPGASIGSRLFIDHGTGVVIGETCEIGNNVKIYQGVTLGAKSPFEADGTVRRGQKRHPTIEDDVIIYANATILGGETVIGRGAIVNGNTWITRSVPPRTVVHRD